MLTKHWEQKELSEQSLLNLRSNFRFGCGPLEFTSQREIASLIALGKDPAQCARKHRKLSDAARMRISEAQRKRWAKQKATTKG